MQIRTGSSDQEAVRGEGRCCVVRVHEALFCYKDEVRLLLASSEPILWALRLVLLFPMAISCALDP